MTRVVVVALLVVALAGCSREFGPGESTAGTGGGRPGANVDATADAARTKLTLQVQDACYAGDPRAAWTRCARWVEETASSARTAAGALTDDPRVAAGATAVAAGHDAFLGLGCGTGAPGFSPDAGACVGALEQARAGVRELAQALGGIPGA